MIATNANKRFHKCMPKELHQPYDLMKLMDKQDKQEKEVEKKEEKKVQLDKNTSYSLNIETQNKNDSLLDIYT